MPAQAKTTRVDTAYEMLKGEILLNRMPSGYQAPEPEIAAKLGMSRTPVREALIRLEAEGLIELIPRRGVRVLPILAQDMAEIYQILTALEPEAAADVAARGLTEVEFAALDEATTEMELALARDDLDSWAAADDRFHRKLLEIHGNRRMAAMIATLSDQAHRARMVTLRMRKKPVNSTRDHRTILNHIRAGDQEAARAAFRAHREAASRELLAILKEYRLSQL